MAAAARFHDDRRPGTPAPRQPHGIAARSHAPSAAARRSSSWSASPPSVPRSPPRGSWRRTSAPRRSCGRTRSAPCSSRSRSATGSAGGSPTGGRTWRASRAGCSARACCSRSCRSSPGRSSRSPSRRSTGSTSAPFVGSLVGVLALVAVPVLLLGAVSPWAIRLSVARVDDAGRDGGQPVRALDRRLAARHVGGHALLIPLIGTQRTFISMALVVALVAALALPRRMLLVPLGIAAAARHPARRDQAAARRRARARGARDGAAVRARGPGARRRAPAGAQRGASSSTRRGGGTRCSPATTGTAGCPRRSPCSGARRARWRSSATAPAPPCAPTRSCSPPRRSTAWRSTAR